MSAKGRPERELRPLGEQRSGEAASVGEHTSAGRQDVLLDALCDAGSASPGDWETLIRRAREADLLGTLAHRLDSSGAFTRVPDAPRAHLVAARIMCTAHAAAVRREVAEIRRSLSRVDAPLVFLKGAAYLLAGLPAAHGRLFSDVDILVPRQALPAVEAALMLAGFATTHHHPYDQRYYRRWMHELPPMQHVKRLTLLDVHHTIVPQTSRVRLDASALLRCAVPLPDLAGSFVLMPADMVLHSAAHLFYNEDLTHGLRDLVDLDALLRHFAADDGFFAALAARARELDLGRPLHYALRWTSQLLATPIPRETLTSVATDAPGVPLGRLMDALFAPALRPTAMRASTRWARRALYVRGHWLKMPLPLLAWHLAIKSFRRPESQSG